MPDDSAGSATTARSVPWQPLPGSLTTPATRRSRKQGARIWRLPGCCAFSGPGPALSNNRQRSQSQRLPRHQTNSRQVHQRTHHGRLHCFRDGSLFCRGQRCPAGHGGGLVQTPPTLLGFLEGERLILSKERLAGGPPFKVSNCDSGTVFAGQGHQPMTQKEKRWPADVNFSPTAVEPR